MAVGDRVLIQEDVTGQATVHQLDPQDSPPVDYRGLAADALTSSDVSDGSTAASDNQDQGTGLSSATQVPLSASFSGRTKIPGRHAVVFGALHIAHCSR